MEGGLKSVCGLNKHGSSVLIVLLHLLTCCILK